VNSIEIRTMGYFCYGLHLMPGERHVMPSSKVKLLIVDDDVALRMSLSELFTELGHSARSAEDGFSGLSEIRTRIPDIILSDLNMPSMSGFEFLSVVRRRFPAIRVIAMSGTFSGGVVPPGVVADAFYEKGTNLSSLLQIVQDMTHMEQRFIHRPSTLAPIWIAKNGHDRAGEEYVMITCPECLRVFPQVFGKKPSLIKETDCVHCSNLIHYAIVEPSDSIFVHAPQR
jgi:CheY-like chemotaxis protein